MLEGHLLSERYRIKAKIGGGGMANVYLANDIILNRDVAIKVLRLEYANDEEFIQRFDREAQAATSLSHPNIVNIYDVGEEDHILYMVMEYVDGLTLKEYIQRYGAIDVIEAIDIMKQITAAIAHAHANDLVHRDIKPQNILIDSYGNVKVTDFGIAVALSATSLTQTNSILGSVHYLSPEQARGGMATKKSDIYSLGIVLFELLTGRLPFSGQSPISIALKHLQNDTPSVRQINPDIPQSIENIVLQATTKDPFHRFDTVYEMENALVTALDPLRVNEDVFTPPVEAGEETKAIPIITNEALHHDRELQDTIVHQNEDTKKVTNNENTGKKPKKKKGKKKKWLFLFAGFILVLLMALLVLSMLSPKDVMIPDVVELEYEEAVDRLEKLKLKTERELMVSEEYEEGLVIKTSPQAGRTVKEGSTITIFVSEGEETVVFEDYTGKDFNQINRMLTEKGFEVIDYDKYSDEPAGTIISQIQPNPGMDVVPGNTKVIFEVSSGPELIQLNNLKGLTEREAKDYLDSQGLKMNKLEENSDDVSKGHVIRQNPAANAELQKGETVNVYFSIGPEKKPPVSYPVSFTVPYTLQDEEDSEDRDEQTVIIYIGDMNNQLSEVYMEDEITNDKDYSITLTIEQNKQAEYKVIRDDEVIIHETVSYKEGG
ncbi:Stk1 family PASTA domain-containing Ser/Thr kinase [Virgibacillus sp. W0430]|uniref:Stk1 family PASTA domain-containing Ser/Thr kinase n=1 Tax=Virgibacillus sp. W0430 TaxID=3391580 RepID=UPI003F461832